MSPITIDAGGLRIAGLSWGEPSDRRLLCLHGWMDNAASFQLLADELQGAQIVALDFPGHGHSAHRAADANYLFVEWVPFVVDALDQLGWQTATLVGHSMGAGVSLLTAAACPERIESLVLIEGLGPMTTEAEETAARLRAAIGSRTRGRTRAPKRYASIDEGIAKLRRFNSGVCDEGARLLVERAMRPIDGGYEFRHDTRLRSSSLVRLTEDQVVNCVEAVECPALLVRGTDGWTAPDQWARRVAAFTDLTIVDAPGSHHVHLDAPADVAAAIRAHFDRSAQ